MEIRFTSSKLVRTSADAELPMPVVRAPDLSGRVFGARYSLRRRIGGGSLGTVYEARDMTLGTAVAVKVLHPDYSGDEDFRRRFHQEARLGARLRHEHSVAVTDLGQSDDGLLYSVMEYLQGESLDALLSSRPGPLPWRRVVTIAVQVCAALQAAHDRGVIHRDIKPGNCFLVRREGHRPSGDDAEDAPPFTFVKVLDLGLARLLPATGRPTPPGRLGAPEYLAPEQIQGFTCDHRVDVYALGVMMYKLLTRRLPFTGDGPAAIMRMHIEAVPTPPRRLAPSADIPAALEAVVLRALAKDRGDRYASAHMMAQAIRAAAADAEAEAIAIDEAPEDLPANPWRTGLGASTSRGTQVSATMILVPAFGKGPDLHRGLVGIVLAVACIAIAITTLWSVERPTLPEHEPTAITTPHPDAPRPNTAGTQTILARHAMPADVRSADTGPAEHATHVGLAAPAMPADVGPIHAAPNGPAAPAMAGPMNPDDRAQHTGAGSSGAVDHAEPTNIGRAGRPAARPASAAATEPVPATLPRTPRRARPTAVAPTQSSDPPALTTSPLAPGAPPERMFHRNADMVAPGVHACMRQHDPPLTTLTMALTVGGPRRTPAALDLGEQSTPALRACLAPLLVRLQFPATEGTARYSHVYRR